MHDAVTIAYRDTWRPTLTVAAAAGVGYVSLATTDFRGFRDFGAIGGYGMLLCWLANYLFMIPLLVVFRRVAPTHGVPRHLPRAHPVPHRRRHPYGAPFAWFARRAPRWWPSSASPSRRGPAGPRTGTFATIRWSTSCGASRTRTAASRRRPANSVTWSCRSPDAPAPTAWPSWSTRSSR
ncbi:MAG: MMPL family transporter [Myxococcales bacterium]|nr:MMPL family transporter [Myxococcales bacterium]